MTEAGSSNDDIYRMVIECDILFDYFFLPSETNVKTSNSPGQGRQTGRENDVPTRDSKTISGSQIDLGGEDDCNRRNEMEAIKRDFDMWIKYTGALTAVERSLDDRLAAYPDIKEMVVELLQMLFRNLQYIIGRETTNSNVSLSLSSIDSQALEKKAWIATKQAVDDLHFMAATIRRSSVQSEMYNLSSRLARDDDLYFEEFAKLLVKRKYPNARRSLYEQLGTSIAVRRKRLFHRKIHEEKLGERRQEALADHGPPLQPTTVSASQLNARPKPPLLQMLNKANHHPTNSADTRSRFDGTAARGHLKGRPSLSTISRGSTVRDSEIDYPEIPQLSDGEERFTCPYCAKPLEAEKFKKDPKYWKSHIDEDAKPYVCLSEECRSPLLFFAHMRDWLDHMKTIHSEQWNRKIHMTSWYCDVKHDTLVFNDYHSFVNHMKDPKNHPGKPPPTALQLDALSRKKQKLLIRDEMYSCPLCDCVPNSIKPVIRTDGSNPNDVRDSLEKHIAKHVKTLAFISVPVWTTRNLDQKTTSGAGFEEKEGRRMRGDNSPALYLSGLDSDICAMSLSFVEDPQRLYVHVSEDDFQLDDFYRTPDTRESYWDDIGFNNFKLCDASAEPDDSILAHFARIKSSAEEKDDNVKVENHQYLGRMIRKTLQTSSWEREGRKFLPIDKLDQIITRKTIREELQRQGSNVSLVNDIWEDEGSRTSSLTTRRRIFAILVLVDKVPAIIDFIHEDISDNDLPFVFRDGTGDREGSFDVYRKAKQRDGEPDKEVELPFFHKWTELTLEAFDQNQWQLLAPFFSLASKNSTNVLHYNLDSRVVFPFIEDNIVNDPPVQYGGSAEVRRVKIHRAHQNLSIFGDEVDHPSYAVKLLNSNNLSAFKSEVDALKRFSGKNNRQHLINLLLTYRYRDRYHLLFHWADGNLLGYWKTKYPSPDTPVRDARFSRWVCRQWLGVVEGLQAIHTYKPDPAHDAQDPSVLYGQHGDLKAENILWFRSPDFDDGAVDNFGSFVISDFGLMRFHREGTKSQVNPDTLGRSHSYRPPEYDVQKEVSQKCDIWSLGCVLLEFLHWYALGWKGVQDFQNSRMRDGSSPDFQTDDYFNYVEDDPSQKLTRFKESVKQAFGHLRAIPNPTRFFLDVLDLVQKRLLRMDPAHRASCSEIVRTFRGFNERCVQDVRYCTESVYSKPRRASTDLSQLMAPASTMPQEMKKQLNMTSSSEHDSRVQEVSKSEFTEQNERFIHETRRIPGTQKLRTSDSGTEMIPKDANEVDETIDMIMEQDAQKISPKKVHFMNDGDGQSDYFGTTQKEGMYNENSGRSTEDQ